ncbi:MAG: hypothetical protein ABI587_05205 [Gemmatimonadales bacterium]
MLERFTRAKIDLAAAADGLQREGAAAFAKSWADLLGCLAEKSALLETAVRCDPQRRP